MPRDGGGTYTLPAGNPVISGTIIETAWANPTMSDIAAALTDSLSRTGSGGMLVPFLNADGTVNLPGISWSNQQNMGFYRPGIDEMRVSVAAVDKARWTSSATDPMDVFIGGVWVPVMNEGGDYNPTGAWDFSGASSYISANPYIITGADVLLALRETGATADEGVWNIRVNADQFVLASATDAAPLVDVENALLITRVGTVIGPWTLRGGQWDFSDVAASRLLTITVDGSGAKLLSTVGGLDLDAVASSVNLFHDGTLRALTGLAGTFRVLSNGASDTEKRMIQLEDSGGNVRGEWGWTNTEARMHIENFIAGQEFELRGRDLGGNPRIYFLADPDANTIVRADIDLELQVANGETAFKGTANGKSAMYFNDVEVARTLVVGSGGFEVDNQDTGGGFERVLTTSDILTAPLINGAKVFNTIAQSISDNTETVVNFGSEAYDTNSFHGAQVSRLVIPTGVTRIRLTGQIVFPPNGSSFRRIEIRKNGINNGALDDDMTTMYTQIFASAANASVPNLGMYFDTGILRGVATDYFEVVVYHNAGVVLSLVSQQQWFQIEAFE